MQMVKKAVAYTLFVLVGILVFMPKQEFYYQLEQTLSKNDIVISNETFSEGWFSLKVKNASVYVKGIKVATIDEINLFTLLFYTDVSLENIKLDESLKSLFLEKIEEIGLSYGILRPFHVNIDMKGDFDEAQGSVDLKTKNLFVNFAEVDSLGTVKRQFKKVEEGWQYETSF
jgi:hypothetical protein